MLGEDGKVVGTRNSEGGAVTKSSMSGVAAEDIVASQSDVHNGLVTGADGGTIGHLHYDGMTVVDDDSKAIGIRNDDGAIIGGPIAGVNSDDVAAPKSTVEDDGSVLGPGGRTIGTLQDDGSTVVRDDGSVVGKRNQDGTIVSATDDGSTEEHGANDFDDGSSGCTSHFSEASCPGHCEWGGTYCQWKGDPACEAFHEEYCPKTHCFWSGTICQPTAGWDEATQAYLPQAQGDGSTRKERRARRRAARQRRRAAGAVQAPHA